MNITYAPGDILQIDNAKIIYRNFSGVGDKFNREGDRNFAVVINDKDTADDLIEKNWNVRIKPPREKDGDPFMYLPVKVKFNGRGPVIHVVSGRNRAVFGEDLIGELDDMDIDNIDLDIRPYDWDINGKTGRTAYLQSMEVTQRLDRFAARYAEEEYPEE